MFGNSHDLWGSFEESVLMSCDEVCGYKKSRKCNVNTWWWNSWVKDEKQNKNKHIKKSHTKGIPEALVTVVMSLYKGESRNTFF